MLFFYLFCFGQNIGALSARYFQVVLKYPDVNALVICAFCSGYSIAIVFKKLLPSLMERNGYAKVFKNMEEVEAFMCVPDTSGTYSSEDSIGCGFGLYLWTHSCPFC